jgi:hypothetical protein
MNDYPIRIADKRGNYRIVDLLLSDTRVNSTANNNYAINIALINKDYSIMEFLINDYRVNQSLQ